MKKSRVIAGICLGAAAVCAAAGIYKYIQEKNAGDEYDSIRKEVEREEDDSGESEEADTSAEDTDETAVEIPIDFATLQAQNADVYAWITVPGTSVDYPILQSQDDNSFYLTHALDKSESAAGAIYTEVYNSKTFEDPNTVIYGHDMKNGSMFGTLHDYMDRSFFDTNREIIIYMPDQILHYQIFAAYLYDDRHLLLSFDFWDEDVYQSYLDSVFSIRDMSSYIDTSIAVTKEDKIITLSTCYGSSENQRYLVQAVLISIEN